MKPLGAYNTVVDLSLAVLVHLHPPILQIRISRIRLGSACEGAQAGTVTARSSLTPAHRQRSFEPLPPAVLWRRSHAWKRCPSSLAA
jgi:hypothetical protein